MFFPHYVLKCNAARQLRLDWDSSSPLSICLYPKALIFDTIQTIVSILSNQTISNCNKGRWFTCWPTACSWCHINPFLLVIYLLVSSNLPPNRPACTLNVLAKCCWQKYNISQAGVTSPCSPHSPTSSPPQECWWLHGMLPDRPSLSSPIHITISQYPPSFTSTSGLTWPSHLSCQCYHKEVFLWVLSVIWARRESSVGGTGMWVRALDGSSACIGKFGLCSWLKIYKI